MKIRIIKLTPESLAGLLQGKASAFTSNLPSDAEILDVKMDLFTKQVSMVVRSESFEDVAETYANPRIRACQKPLNPKTSPKPAVVHHKPQVCNLSLNLTIAKLPQTATK